MKFARCSRASSKNWAQCERGKGERAHHRRRPRHALLAGEPRPASQAAVFDRRPQLAARGHYRTGRADNRARANLRAGLCRPARDFPQSAARPGAAARILSSSRVLAAPRSRSPTDAQRLRIAPVAGVVAVMPADHYITPLAAFRRTLSDAIALAATRHAIVVIGVVPDRAGARLRLSANRTARRARLRGRALRREAAA